MRKLARVVRIDDVVIHPNADKLDLYIVGGWQIVDTKGKYAKNDLVIICFPNRVGIQ